MAAATVESHGFHTPGLDQASISTGNEFPFGNPFNQPTSEFNDKFFASDSNNANRNNSAFGFDSAEAVDNGLSSFEFPNTMYLNPDLTPPGVVEGPEGAGQATRLRPINTVQTYGNVRYEHGQWTPEDDLSQDLNWGSLSQDVHMETGETVQDVPIKQENTSDMPQVQISEPKRKRSADNTQPKPKRRRSRKVTMTPAAEGEIIDPVEDDKRNKFLERNRVAASKCRQKKKQWTTNLEHQARQMQQAKTQLNLLLSGLKEEVLWLKGEMLKHTNCGCDHIREYMSRQADVIVVAGRTPTQSAAGLSHQSASGSPEDFATPTPATVWAASRRGSTSMASVDTADQSRPGTGNGSSSSDTFTQDLDSRRLSAD